MICSRSPDADRRVFRAHCHPTHGGRATSRFKRPRVDQTLTACAFHHYEGSVVKECKLGDRNRHTILHKLHRFGESHIFKAVLEFAFDAYTELQHSLVSPFVTQKDVVFVLGSLCKMECRSANDMCAGCTWKDKKGLCCPSAFAHSPTLRRQILRHGFPWLNDIPYAFMEEFIPYANAKDFMVDYAILSVPHGDTADVTLVLRWLRTRYTMRQRIHEDRKSAAFKLYKHAVRHRDPLPDVDGVLGGIICISQHTRHHEFFAPPLFDSRHAEHGQYCYMIVSGRRKQRHALELDLLFVGRGCLLRILPRALSEGGVTTFMHDIGSISLIKRKWIIDCCKRNRPSPTPLILQTPCDASDLSRYGTLTLKGYADGYMPSLTYNFRVSPSGYITYHDALGNGPQITMREPIRQCTSHTLTWVDQVNFRLPIRWYYEKKTKGEPYQFQRRPAV